MSDKNTKLLVNATVSWSLDIKLVVDSGTPREEIEKTLIDMAHREVGIRALSPTVENMISLPLSEKI